MREVGAAPHVPLHTLHGEQRLVIDDHLLLLDREGKSSIIAIIISDGRLRVV